MMSVTIKKDTEMTSDIISTDILDITPDCHRLYSAISGNFVKLAQIISEFIDNSLSDFRAHKDEPGILNASVASTRPRHVERRR